MKNKICISCNIEKSGASFYKHKGMADGHLNKCKECVKLYSKQFYFKGKENPEWYSKELNRQKIKNQSSKRLIKYNETYPEKYEAKLISQRMSPPIKGHEKHHWSYNEEHYRDVIWLSRKDHATAHRFIVYDQERKMYRKASNGILLDTRESHETYILNIINGKS